MAGSIYPIQSLADGSVKWSDGSVTGSMSTNQGYASSSFVPGTTTNNQNYQTPISQQTSAPQQQSSGFDRMDRNSNPGAGWFYDAADGWKQENGGKSQAEIDAQNQLNSGYDEYYKSLDQQLSGLGSQKAGQEGLAQASYQHGMDLAGGQYSQGQQNLESNRQKTLRDLSSNLSQSFQQGNQVLGARGASDSSAASQYAYALAKQGNQARGDVQSQYDQNLFNLKNTYDTNIKELEFSKTNQLSQIAQWYDEARNQISGLRGQAALQKSQQALNMAMQMAQQVQQENASKRATLDQWAANNAQSYQQLAGQLAQTGNFSMNAPQVDLFGQQPQQGGNQLAFGAGASTNDDKFRGIFGSIA